MSSNLKALGLALVATIALSAMVAGTGAAAELHVAKDNKGATGEPINHAILDWEVLSAQRFTTTESGEIKCNELTADGTVEEAEPSEVSITPTYSGCTYKNSELELTAHIEHTGCTFLLTAELEGERAPIHIECPEEAEIHAKVTFLGFKIQCITIPAQTPTGGGVTYTNGKKGGYDDITSKAEVEGIAYTTYSNCGGEAEGGYETLNNGAYHGSITSWATDTEGAMLHYWWK